jgi:uncharacterized membrane protein
MNASLNLKRKAPDVKSWIFKRIFSPVGPAITAGVSAALGYIVTWLASFSIVLDADMQSHIAYVLTGITWLVIDQLINRYAGQHAASIQEALGVDADRWIGPKTVNAAQAKRPTQILD